MNGCDTSGYFMLYGVTEMTKVINYTDQVTLTDWNAAFNDLSMLKNIIQGQYIERIMKLKVCWHIPHKKSETIAC